MAADWSLLPYDVLGYIALNLSAIEDLVCFSVVCHSWNDVFSMVKQNWSPKMPWLLLPQNNNNNNNKDNENPDFHRKVFSPCRNKCYRLDLPQLFESRCWGSSYGWVVAIDLDLQLYMFNPLTKVRIRLPPQPTMPNQPGCDDIEPGCDDIEPEWFRTSFVRKAIVLKLANDNEDGFVVMAVHGEFHFLAFARPGDRAWTRVPTPADALVSDVACLDGRIVLMYSDGALVYCDIERAQKGTEVVVKLTDFVPAPRGVLEALTKRIHGLYLVESSGDLLMVLRYKNELFYEDDPDQTSRNFSYETWNFEVYRLDPESKGWGRVKDLGDIALFVGDSASMSVSASCASNCRTNCIYFADDEVAFWKAPRDLGGHDMGFFDMGTEEFDEFYEGDDIHSDFCTSLWFMPKLS